jgi:hypothetical protein
VKGTKSRITMVSREQPPRSALLAYCADERIYRFYPQMAKVELEKLSEK